MDRRTLLERLESNGIEHLWTIYHDYNGRACGKSIPKERFHSVVDGGVTFARANLDFTIDDHQAEGARFLADTGDFLAVPVPDTYAVLPYHEATARTHVHMRKEDGTPWEGCPRTRLERMVEDYAAEGLTVRAGFEPEFILFQKTNDGEYRPADTDGMYTVTGLDRHHALWRDIESALRDMGITMEQLGKEYGPAQYEATTLPADPLNAVDNYLTYKQVVQALARQSGFIASFMPKPYAHLPGSGLHLHLSLWDKTGQDDLSKGEADGEPLSTLGGHFAAGLLAHACALSGIGSPIVNSYKRLLPASWAPAHVCWGVGNRAALVRVPGMGDRRHLEYRSADNAANPFSLFIAVLAAGLDGIRSQAALPAPATDDVGHLSSHEAQARGLEFLPRSLPEALSALESDEIIGQALGPVILGEFLKVKRTELSAYDVHVHPWERGMYLETI